MATASYAEGAARSEPKASVERVARDRSRAGPRKTRCVTLRPMDVGIVGHPGSGRTTAFHALLAHRAPPEAGAKHKPAAIGVIRVPDARLDRLSALFKPLQTTPIEIVTHDLCPSLEPSFPTSELEAMKRMDVLLLVVPAFANPSPDAIVAELSRLVGDLCLEDLAAVERRLERARKERTDATTVAALEAARATLDAELPLWAAELADTTRRELRAHALVTDRPMIAVCNVGESDADKPAPKALVARGAELGIPALSLCASLEAEMAQLTSQERVEFLTEYGVQEPASGAVTRAILASADIVPFFTVGEDECRAWPIRRGTCAREAAGKVHSDIERGFIRAEVVSFDELEPLAGLLVEAKKKGVLRLEGKDYVVRGGDVVHFRFNV